jgi:hypothetical protein
MLSGRRLDLLDPSPLDIEIADIAHGLARVARWNGQTSGAHIFSVAQHTLLVEAVMREQMPRVDARFRLAALLHDAPEYVIGDMISPFKAVLGGDYKAVEKRLLSAIRNDAGNQGRRPRRGLSGSNPSGGICDSRSQAPVRQRSRFAARDASRLHDPLDRRPRREAVSGTVRETVPVRRGIGRALVTSDLYSTPDTSPRRDNCRYVPIPGIIDALFSSSTIRTYNLWFDARPASGALSNNLRRR